MAATRYRYKARAALLGRSVCSIKNKRQALSRSSSDASSRPWTKEEEQLLLEMAAAKFSYKAMADKLGRTMHMVKEDDESGRPCIPIELKVLRSECYPKERSEW
jgi:hypothetical protein